jgi:integrase
MSVRRITRRQKKTGKPREFWMVDVVFEHVDGRMERIRKVSPVQTKRGAEEYERKLRAELLSPTPKPKEVAPTFDKFVDERWLPIYPGAAGNRHSTIVHREAHLRLHLRAPFGRLRLDEIGREHIARFYAEMTKRGLSPKSRKNIGGTLRTILGTAVDWEVIEKLPKFPRVKVPDAAWDFYTREESKLLLSKTRNAFERALLLFALHTGARAGEQVAIDWGDLDWHNRLVIIRRSSALGRVGPTKSGRERKVPMTAELESALRAIKHLRSTLVFCNEDGRPLSKWQLHERLWGTARRAGLREIRWHDLRHSFASQLVIAGVPIVQVQQWLGHTTIAMTMRYAHLAPGSGAAHIKALETEPAPVYGNLTATGAG